MTQQRESAPVSLIIPCHDAAKFVRAAIESVLAQSLGVAEIIVVDDASTDESAQVVASLAATRGGIVRLESLARNGGVAHARAHGIAAAAHDTVVTLDADDVLHPDAIRALWTHAQAHPEHAVIYGDYVNMTEQGELLDVVSLRRRRDDPLDGAILGTMLWENVAAPNALLRRAHVDAVGGYWLPEVGREADAFSEVFLYMRLLAAGHTFGYVEHPIFHYRQHGASMSRDREKARQHELRALGWLFARHPEAMASAFHTMRTRRALQLADAFVTIEARDAAIAAQRIASGELHAEIDRARAFQGAQAGLLAARDEECATLHVEVERARQFQGGLVSELAVREREIATLRRELERAGAYQRTLEEACGTREAKVAELEAETARARVYQDALERHRDAQAETIARQAGDLASAADYQRKQETDLAATARTIHELGDEIVRARAFQERLGASHDAQQATIAALRADIETARVYQASCEATIETLAQRLASHERDIDEARAFQARMQDVIDAQSAQIDEQSQELARIHGGVLPPRDSGPDHVAR